MDGDTLEIDIEEVTVFALISQFLDTQIIKTLPVSSIPIQP